MALGDKFDILSMLLCWIKASSGLSIFFHIVLKQNDIAWRAISAIVKIKQEANAVMSHLLILNWNMRPTASLFLDNTIFQDENPQEAAE